MTDQQLARIDFLLYDCEDDDTFAETLRRIESPAELHALAAQIDWDGGLSKLNSIVAHPLCDRGTALLIYWHGEPAYFAEFASNEDVPAVNRPLKQFLNRVEAQLMTDHFKSNTICFDPMSGMNAVQRRKIETVTSIPSALKRPNC
ncbi:MAG: DUF4274 domain-containing protein [Aureliella sp.]